MNAEGYLLCLGVVSPRSSEGMQDRISPEVANGMSESH